MKKNLKTSLASQDTVSSDALEELRAMMRKGTLSHSFLFVGRPGWGKKALAQALGRLLLCRKGVPRGACACEACTRVDLGQHPDVRWFGEDEAKRSFGIAEVRALLHWMSFRPFEGKAKLAVLVGSERLTTEAGNAMLKLLEEPSPESYLVLLTSNIRRVLDTLRSRCMPIRLRPMAVRDIARLLERSGLSPNEAAYLSKKSGGSFARARALYEEGMWLSRNALIDGYVSGGPERLFSEWAKLKRNECLTHLRTLEDWFRDVLIYSATGLEAPLLHRDRLADVRRAAEGGMDIARARLDDLLETERALESNVNQKLALTRLSMLFAS